MIRKVLLAALSALVLVLLAGSDVAHADEDIIFGIRPTKAQADNPESFSYFSHSLAPGAVLEEQALVIDEGEGPITLKVYVSDGITAVNGGTTFTKPGIGNHGVDRWISLPDSEITLRPGEDKVVPFTIRVPSDAAPGEHVAGIVAEAGADPMSGNEGSPSGSESAAFGVQVVRRVGVAVLVDVPGARVPNLEITHVGMSEQNDNGAVFTLSVLNTGNISLKAEGTLAVKDSDGVELASVPTELLDTVLAGDDTFYYVRHSLHLEDGDYLLCATLDYYAARGDETGTAICPHDFELTIKDGQPVTEDGPLPPAEPPGIVNIGGGDDGAGGIGAQEAVGLAVALALALAAGLLFRRRRRRANVTGPGPDTEPPPDRTAPPEAQPSPEAEASPESEPSRASEASRRSLAAALTSLERVTAALDVLEGKISRDLPTPPGAEDPPQTEESPESGPSFEPVASPDSVASCNEEVPSTGPGAAELDMNLPLSESVTDVPGVTESRISGLEVTRLGIREQNGKGAVFVFNVRVMGDNLPKAEGTLAIKDRAGNELTTAPLVLGTAPAASETLFYGKHPVRLQDGAYLLRASLQFYGARGQEADNVTCAQDFELKIRDGKPEVSKPKRGGSSEPSTEAEAVTFGGADAQAALAQPNCPCPGHHSPRLPSGGPGSVPSPRPSHPGLSHHLWPEQRPPSAPPGQGW